MRKTTSLLLLGTLLSGCTMIPDYLRPDLPTQNEWQSPALSESGQQMAAEIAWQDFFLSEGLRGVIQASLENNRDLRVATLNVEAARALYRVERADLIPNIGLNGGMSRQKVTRAQGGSNPNFATSREYITSTYTVNVATTAFELDLFGRTQSLSEAALEDYFATEAARDAAQISLIAEVANAYLQWMADHKILALTKDTLAAQEKSYNLISQSFEKGVASKLDVAQVQQSVQTARANLALYERYVQQDKNALQLLVGNKDITPLLKDQQLETLSLRNELPVGLPSEVLLVRPDVRQAEHNLLAANANIGAARAAFFPTLSLTASYGYASSELDNLFSSAASGAWSFAPSIAMPIFEGGRNFANLDYSEVIKEASVAQYEKAVQTAFKEVADELAARETLDDELDAQRKLVEATQESYDLSNARYKEGIDSYLNVLDAQRSLYSAQQREIEIEKQRMANLVNLYKALGGGLENAEAAQESAPEDQPETPEAKAGTQASAE